MARWTLRMARNDAEMTAVRVEADADDADLEGERMERSANHGEWREFTAKTPLITPDREVMTANGSLMTANEPVITANGKKSAPRA